MPNLHPDAPGWPCRTEPRAELPDRLVSALYVLLRDHLHPGDLEQLLCELSGTPTWRNTTFSNPHLEALARAHATFLLDGVKTYPYVDGDVLVIGPQCFIGIIEEAGPTTESVINYRGQNFVPQGAPAAVADDDSSEKPAKCPTCGSPDPRRHPATQFEGEVQPCGDTWHGPKVSKEEALGIEEAARRPTEGAPTPRPDFANVTGARTEEDLVATEITVAYPVGKHTFKRTANGGWVLHLDSPPGLGGDDQRVTGYDDANVKRVIGAFLGDPPEAVEVDDQMTPEVIELFGGDIAWRDRIYVPVHPQGSEVQPTVTLTLAEAENYQAVVMGDHFETDLLDSAAKKIEAVRSMVPRVDEED